MANDLHNFKLLTHCKRDLLINCIQSCRADAVGTTISRGKHLELKYFRVIREIQELIYKVLCIEKTQRLCMVINNLCNNYILGTKVLNPRLLSSGAWSTALRTHLPSGKGTPCAAGDQRPVRYPCALYSDAQTQGLIWLLQHHVVESNVALYTLVRQ